MTAIPVTPEVAEAAKVAETEAELRRRMGRVRANAEFEVAMGPGYVLHIDTAFTRPWRPRFLSATLRPFNRRRS